MLHIGYALPETVEFFSRYRCKLLFVDLFEDLDQLAPGESEPRPLDRIVADLLRIPAGTQLDLCLFWDVFNFLGGSAISALMQVLRPHLHHNTLAHGFAVHNLRTPQSGSVYGIKELDQISVRPRPTSLPGYSPCNQGQLERALDYFKVTRSVLLAQSRLELLLRAHLPD